MIEMGAFGPEHITFFRGLDEPLVYASLFHSGQIGLQFRYLQIAVPPEKAFFCISLYYLWSGYHNYSDSDFLEGLFSRRQIAQLWEAGNYKDYKATVDDYHMDIYNLLTDIIPRGDSAISDGNVCADLRFGHDVVINMLLMELNIGTMGVPENPDDVKNCFKSAYGVRP